MPSADENRPMKELNQRHSKKNAETRAISNKQNDPGEHRPQVTLTAISPETSEKASEETNTLLASTEGSKAEASATNNEEIAPAVLPQPVPVNLQTFTAAYCGYARKSLEQNSAFLLKLAGARSPTRVFELQMEYAKLAWETLIADSRREMTKWISRAS